MNQQPIPRLPEPNMPPQQNPFAEVDAGLRSAYAQARQEGRTTIEGRRKAAAAELLRLGGVNDAPMPQEAAHEYAEQMRLTFVKKGAHAGYVNEVRNDAVGFAARLPRGTEDVQHVAYRRRISPGGRTSRAHQDLSLWLISAHATNQETWTDVKGRFGRVRQKAGGRYTMVSLSMDSRGKLYTGEKIITYQGSPRPLSSQEILTDLDDFHSAFSQDILPPENTPDPRRSVEVAQWRNTWREKFNGMLMRARATAVRQQQSAASRAPSPQRQNTGRQTQRPTITPPARRRIT